MNELASQETVFSTRSPGIPGSLNGTQTSVTISVGTLRAGCSYLAAIIYGLTPPDTNGHPDAPELVGLNNQTQFSFTVPGTAFTNSLALPATNQFTGCAIAPPSGREKGMATRLKLHCLFSSH